MKTTLRAIWLLAGCNLWVAGALSSSLSAQPSVSIQNVDVTEGNAGSADAVLTVTLSATASGVVTVSYATVNLSAPDSAIGGANCGGSPTDYVTETGSVQFNPGQTSQTIGVTVCGDAVDEINERFRVELSNPAGATFGERRARVTINNDDGGAPPLPSISVDDVSFPEGNSGIVIQNATVRLSAATSEPVTVVVSIVSGGTATASTVACTPTPTAPVPGDFVLSPPRSVTITPGQTSVIVAFAICGDTAFEPNETFSVSAVLVTPLAATLGDGVGQLTISNDDAAPVTVSVDDASFPEGNSGGTARTVKMRLSAPTTQDVTVDVSVRLGAGVTGGVCTVGRDFNFIPGLKVTVPAGAPDTNISFPICGDTQVESDETFTLVLANPTGGVRLGDAEGTVTILNDDAAAGDTLRAELLVELISLSTQTAPNLAFGVRARNTGNTAASPVAVRFQLPKDVAFVGLEENTMGPCSQNSTSADGALQVNCVMAALVAGGNKGVRILGKTPDSAIAGSTEVVYSAAIDPSNTVPEGNDINNLALGFTTVLTPADLQVRVTPNGLVFTGRGRTRLPFPLVSPGSLSGNTVLDFPCIASGSVLGVGLTVTNLGPNPTPSRGIVASWPSGWVNPGGCFEFCAVPSLNPGQSATLGLAGLFNVEGGFAGGEVTFRLDAVFDPIPGNNTATLGLGTCGG
jgi:Calx-beta domain-containing protein